MVLTRKSHIAEQLRQSLREEEELTSLESVINEWG